VPECEAFAEPEAKTLSVKTHVTLSL